MYSTPCKNQNISSLVIKATMHHKGLISKCSFAQLERKREWWQIGYGDRTKILWGQSIQNQKSKELGLY